MIRVQQTLSDATHGNCHAACLASILEIPLAAFPKYIHREDWWQRINRFLFDRYGLALENFEAGWVPEGYWIAVVPSKNLEDELHSVVMKGDTLAHDPAALVHYNEIHPDQVKEVEVLRAADPARAIRSLATPLAPPGGKGR